MEPTENGIIKETLPKKLFIEKNEPALITIKMNQDFEDWLKTMHFTPRMYFENRIGYLKDRIGLAFKIDATESCLAIRPIAGHQFDDVAMSAINKLLAMANQE